MHLLRPATSNTDLNPAAVGDPLAGARWKHHREPNLEAWTSLTAFDSGAVIEDIRTIVVPSNATRHGGLLVAEQIGAANVVDANRAEVVLGAVPAYPVGSDVRNSVLEFKR